MLLFGDVIIIKPVNIYCQLQVLTFFSIVINYNVYSSNR